MKKVMILCMAATLLWACGGKQQSIKSSALEGKYEIDFSEALNQISEEDDETGGLVKMFAAMLLSSLNMTMEFDGENVIVDGSGAAMNFVKVFGKGGFSTPVSSKYKIENGNVLFIQNESGEWVNAGTLSKVGKTYDVLQWKTEGDEGKETILTLRKTAE